MAFDDVRGACRAVPRPFAVGRLDFFGHWDEPATNMALATWENWHARWTLEGKADFR